MLVYRRVPWTTIDTEIYAVDWDWVYICDFDHWLLVGFSFLIVLNIWGGWFMDWYFSEVQNANQWSYVKMSATLRTSEVFCNDWWVPITSKKKPPAWVQVQVPLAQKSLGGHVFFLNVPRNVANMPRSPTGFEGDVAIRFSMVDIGHGWWWVMMVRDCW